LPAISDSRDQGLTLMAETSYPPLSLRTRDSERPKAPMLRQHQAGRISIPPSLVVEKHEKRRL